MKWEPIAAMLALVAISLWLVWGPTHRLYGIEPRPGAHTVEVRVGGARGLVEVTRAPDGQPVFRVLLRTGHASPDLSAPQFRDLYGDEVYNAVVNNGGNPLFRIFNITSWGSFFWVSLGLGGQLAFSARTLVQWIISEKRNESVVPVVFWWLSLWGGLGLFAYFVWRQDVVGVLGQCTGVVIYVRNLRLIYKQRSRAPAAVAHRSVPS